MGKDYFIISYSLKMLIVMFSEDCKYLAKNNFVFIMNRQRLYIQLIIDGVIKFNIIYLSSVDKSRLLGKRITKENTISNIKELLEKENIQND